MIILGVDPGKTGGLAILVYGKDKKVRLLSAIPMPIAVLPNRKPMLAWELAKSFLSSPYAIDVGIIEDVHSMPAQGVASSFQFGRMFGAAEMMMHHHCQYVHYVQPRIWKKYFGIVKQHKSVSTVIATELYGNKYWPLKKHEGIAEAALIATWGFEQYQRGLWK